MKQHITVEQWDSLINEHEGPKLDEWLIDNLQPEIGDSMSESFNIGKMIEILDNESFQFGIMTYISGFPRVSITTNVSGKMSYVEEELCDALWEAVKMVINE